MRIAGISTVRNCSISSRNNYNRTYIPALYTNNIDTVSFKNNGDWSKKVALVPSSTKTDLEEKLHNFFKKHRVKPDTPLKDTQFKNKEIGIQLDTKDGKIENKDVFIVQPAKEDPNDNLMEMFIKAYAAKSSGAKKVIAILPWYDYARQEKRMEPGEPITASLVADLFRASGVDHIITVDIHSTVIEGFVKPPMRITNITTDKLVADYFRTQKDFDFEANKKDMIIVSPDMGAAKRSEHLAKELLGDEHATATIFKRRPKPNETDKATINDLVGDVQDKICVLYDDMIDTGGTIIRAAELLKSKGARDIYIFATHGLFNGQALTKLKTATEGSNPVVKNVITTNTFPQKHISNFVDINSDSASVEDALKNNTQDSSFIFDEQNVTGIKRIDISDLISKKIEELYQND